MKPGRELDRLIAERVMDWKQATAQQSYVTHGCTHVLPDGSLDVVPEFSTDIAAAWEVVEKLGLGVEIKNRMAYVPDTWQVIFVDGSHKESRAGGENPAHAICLAALKAVGYQGASTV